MYAWHIRRRLKRSESLMPRDDDGIRIGCREYTVGSGNKALLMIHGFGDSPAVFSVLASELSTQGFTCRAMRLPGFGSTVEESARYNEDDWMTAIYHEVEELAKTHQQVWIVAHSLGCTLAIRHLIDNHSAVSGLICLAPLIKVSRRRSPFFSPRTWHSIGRRLLLFTQVIENTLPENPKSALHWRQDLIDHFYHFSIYTRLFKAISRIQNKAHKLTKPMLMVVSSNDNIIDTNAAIAFFDRTNAIYKRLIYTDKSGHMIPLDHGWQYISNEIDVFIGCAQTPILAESAKDIVTAAPTPIPAPSMTKPRMA